MKDPNSLYKVYKRLSANTVIYQPPIKEGGETSIAVYYAVSEDIPSVAKCFERNTFKTIPAIDNCFLILNGKQAKVILTPNNRYYMSPYCNSGTMKEVLASGVKFTHEQLVQFLCQVAYHLNRIHGAGLYHGELFPEHVLINTEPDGELTFKLCGFGHYMKKSKEYLMNSNIIPYLDPRVIDNPEKEYDSKCDIWSLGIMAYKLATGEFPDLDEKYNEGTINEYLSGIASEGISTTLNYLLSRCMNSNPKARISAKNISTHPFFIPSIEEIKDYKITTEKLGSGRSSSVVLAKSQHNPTHKHAVKILVPLDLMDDKTKMQVLGEITILMLIKDCPYVIRLEDFFEFKREVHLILEYCNGGDLGRYLTNEKKQGEIGVFMLEEIKLIAYYLSQAINFLHDKNIIHRDVKPKNSLVLLDEKTKKIAQVKLADFGASRELLSKDMMAETFVGTPKYAAPEILSNSYTIKADVWSYGVILYSLAYDVMPSDYGGPHTIDSDKSIKYPSKPLHGLPDSFIRLIRGCLTFDPIKRLSMSDVVAHEYFNSNPCATFDKLPKCYTIDSGSPLMENSTYCVRGITYNPTKTKLIVKILKGPISKSDQDLIIKGVNTLISLRGCNDVFKLHHSFIIGGNYYFILDYTLGETLHNYVTKKTVVKMSVKEIKGIGLAIARAISDTYERNVKHERISPMNVYICPENTKEEVPIVKLAGYSQIVQGLNSEVESTRNDIDAFGELLYFLIYRDTQDYPSGINSVKETQLSSHDLKEALKIVKDCANGTYKTPLKIPKLTFFEY